MGIDAFDVIVGAAGIVNKEGGEGRDWIISVNARCVVRPPYSTLRFSTLTLANTSPFPYTRFARRSAKIVEGDGRR